MRRIEWPTFGLWLGCLGLWGLSLYVLAELNGLLAGVGLILSLVMHGSLTHEVVHGHPFRARLLSEALVWVNPGLFVPYIRFRETHLAHHRDARLTDPYEDPESNYLDPAVWNRMSGAERLVRRANNTLLGRMVIGPGVGQWDFVAREVRAGWDVVWAWASHAAGVGLVLWLVWQSAMPVWGYLVAAYLAMSVLKVRTFLEHQADAHAAGRTVIIEKRCFLAFLFLYNSLHMVHHMHPRVPWYRLPGLFEGNRARYLGRGNGYVYASYADIFRTHLFRTKDPVPHPLWRSGR